MPFAYISLNKEDSKLLSLDGAIWSRGGRIEPPQWPWDGSATYHLVFVLLKNNRVIFVFLLALYMRHQRFFSSLNETLSQLKV